MTIRFVKDAVDITIRSPRFPYRDVSDLRQFKGKTAGGTQIVQDNGAEEAVFVLHFVNLTDTMKDNLNTFWTDSANGAANTFSYFDPNANEFTVRWMDDLFDFREGPEGRWRGDMTLQDET